MKQHEPRVFSDVHGAQTYIKSLREKGKTLVTTNGCFDVVHVGHVRYLLEAASLGDILAVGINSDDTVRALKGEKRPLQRQEDRATVIAALGMVDCAFIFPENDPRGFLEILRPDIHVKGGDYPQDIIERPVVEQHGGKIRILSMFQGYSTTSILDRIQKK